MDRKAFLPLTHGKLNTRMSSHDLKFTMSYKGNVVLAAGKLGDIVKGGIGLLHKSMKAEIKSGGRKLVDVTGSTKPADAIEQAKAAMKKEGIKEYIEVRGGVRELSEEEKAALVSLAESDDLTASVVQTSTGGGRQMGASTVSWKGKPVGSLLKDKDGWRYHPMGAPLAKSAPSFLAKKGKSAFRNPTEALESLKKNALPLMVHPAKSRSRIPKGAVRLTVYQETDAGPAVSAIVDAEEEKQALEFYVRQIDPDDAWLDAKIEWPGGKEAERFYKRKGRKYVRTK